MCRCAQLVFRMLMVILNGFIVCVWHSFILCLILKLYIFFKIFICVCVCEWAPWLTCGGQKIIFEKWFCPSTIDFTCWAISLAHIWKPGLSADLFCSAAYYILEETSALLSHLAISVYSGLLGRRLSLFGNSFNILSKQVSRLDSVDSETVSLQASVSSRVTETFYLER